MSAIEILKAQHRDVLHLFKRVTSSDNGERSPRVDELIGKLRLHSRLEETIVYPAIQSAGNRLAEDEVLESYEEHAIVDFILAQLQTMERQSQQFQARLRVLQSLVEDHIEEEETEVFKHLDQLDDEQRLQLDARVAAEVEELEEVDAILDRAARAARRTERWAGSLLDASLGFPRRAASVLAPTRWLGLDRRHVWAIRIAASVPRVVVDSIYRTVTGQQTSSSRRAA